MMNKTERNYWLLLTVAHFIILFFIRERIYSIDSALNLRPFSTYEESQIIFDAHRNNVEAAIIVYYASLVFSFLVICIISYRFILEKKEEVVNFLPWALVYIAFAIISLVYDGGVFSFNYDEIRFTVLFYGLFLPYIYLIIKYTIVGEEIDLTESYLQNNEKKFDENLAKLSELRDANILSGEEFNEKNSEILAKKIKQEFLVSSEYKKLKELESAKVLSKEEVENKIEELVQARIKNAVNTTYKR